jgi:nucleotide-binding universal stress UspA family protein
MYERILAAVDRSEVADRVLAAAGELAAMSDGEVVVLHVREHDLSKFPVVPPESRGEAQSFVDDAVTKLTAAGVKAVGSTRDAVIGFTGAGIVDEAGGLEADVILLGSRGRRELAERLHGSTGHKVLRLADRPVLVVR